VSATLCSWALKACEQQHNSAAVLLPTRVMCCWGCTMVLQRGDHCLDKERGSRKPALASKLLQYTLAALQEGLLSVVDAQAGP
jgi:hypothetical protein